MVDYILQQIYLKMNMISKIYLKKVVAYRLQVNSPQAQLRTDNNTFAEGEQPIFRGNVCLRLKIAVILNLT